jgi:CP family cyanate transporter-like MFS transporter
MARPVHTRPVLLGLVIGLVAANLRPALASVGPVLPDLRTDLGLSSAAAAVLTSLPVLCLGALAATAPALARRLGMEPVIALVLAALVAGLLVRVAAGSVLLFAGTVIASGAIAIANVLLPAVIKRDFADRSGTMMGVYSMALSGSAALAAGTTVPIGNALGHGWRGALAFWAVPAVVGLALWAPFARLHHPPPAVAPGARSPVRSVLAWQVTLFFGLQALTFYAVLAWLPTVYRDHGFSPAAAGALLSVSALMQIPITLALPNFVTRVADQRWLTTAATGFTAAGLILVLLTPTSLPLLWMNILGIGQGATFAIGLTLFVVRARDTASTARLSAMAQTFGYLVAAAGPLLFGAVHDVTGSWTPALLLLLALTVPQFVGGGRGRRPRDVD